MDQRLVQFKRHRSASPASWFEWARLVT